MVSPVTLNRRRLRMSVLTPGSSRRALAAHARRSALSMAFMGGLGDCRNSIFGKPPRGLAIIACAMATAESRTVFPLGHLIVLALFSTTRFFSTARTARTTMSRAEYGTPYALI